VLALVGCGGGGDGKPADNGLASQAPARIGAAVVDAFRQAPSFRVVASVTSAKGDASTSYDLLVTASAAQGTVTTDGRTAQIIKIGDDTYIKAPKSYYQADGQSPAADLLADRWVLVTRAQADVYRYFDRSGLALSLDGYVSALGTAVTTTTLGGARSVLVTGPDGTRLWAAGTGRPYPLRLELAGGEAGRLDFSGYGGKATISRPTGAVEAAKLG
jgi:hypothetical protein